MGVRNNIPAATVVEENIVNNVETQRQQPNVIRKQQEQQKNPITMSSDILFLPNLGQESIKRKKNEELLETEMNVGRIAMIAAIIMLGIEIVEGKSLPEQLLLLFSS